MTTRTGPTTDQPLPGADETDPRASYDLDVEGMTCASCAARIEKRLRRLDGVSATVNYATNRALVLAPAGVTADDLVAAVVAAGYGATVHEPDAPEPPDPADTLRPRVVTALALAVPVIAVSMLPVLQLPGWQWLALALTTPVVTWCAWPFHRSAWVNARHGTTTMDTLVSLGTTAAYLWSVGAMLAGDAGRIGMRHTFELTLSRHHAASGIYFEAAAGIVAFILLGRWFEARSRRDAGSAIRALLELGAKEVTVVRDGAERTVAVDTLAVGDLFVVRPGEKIATDGVVTEGTSAVDTALVTGESAPVDVSPGSAVVGATVNTTGRLVVRATRVGADTQLAQMARLVEQAQTGKAPAQRLADTISAVFVPVVIGLAALTAVGWLVAGETLGFALTAAVAVLIIACPCALGLATPTALLVGTGRGAELGIIISGPEVLESTRQVDTVVLDKTGTLTTGTMTVVAVTTLDDADPDATTLAAETAPDAPAPGPTTRIVTGPDGATPDVTTHDATTGDPTTGDPTTPDPTTGDPTTPDPTTGDPTTPDPTTGDPTARDAASAVVAAGDAGTARAGATPGATRGRGAAPATTEPVRRAAAVERGSEHPISKAVAALAPDVPVATGVTTVPGRGVVGTVDGTEVAVGSLALMGERGLTLPQPLATAAAQGAGRGWSTVYVGWDGLVRGVLGVADQPRESAARAVAAFHELGLTPVLLSGDHRAAAEQVARTVGITTVIAEVSPADKVGEVRRLQGEGRTVAMVGDGVNDAAALAQADLGVAMGSGTDAAIAASDLTLMHSDPLAAADAIRLSRATLRTIKTNLFWAFAYNVAALPVAALGLLNPMVAGAAMAFSSVFVVTNSLRLKRFRPL